MVIGIAALEYFFEEGAQNDWFRVVRYSRRRVRLRRLARRMGDRELTATAADRQPPLFRDPTFASRP